MFTIVNQLNSNSNQVFKKFNFYFSFYLTRISLLKFCD